MSGYWTSICELLAVPDDQISSIVLSYPHTTTTMTGGESYKQQHDRYTAISGLMNRMLVLYGTDTNIINVHCEPFYDRDDIPANQEDQKQQPSHGHLPPTKWVQENQSKTTSFSVEQVRLQNYQRRSPLPTVILERVSVSQTKYYYDD
jgi:hypothetical protein